jgi:hypothetical protein
MLSLVENRRFVDEAADVTGSYDVSILHGGDWSLLTLVYHHVGYMLDSQLDWICRGIWADIVGDTTPLRRRSIRRHCICSRRTGSSSV